ncbi:MAG TPA: hypothetical protein VGS78_16645 [Candidatus Sulfotelmatobacter sp.]|nr:hypothetical protein [Candidatus Sulfotelmatobacter sp.]
MRFCVAFILYTLYLFPSAALQQGLFSAPIIDKSTAGAPLEVSGTFTLRESLRANELEWSWGEKVVVKNTSEKAILLFGATISEVGRYSSPDGRRAALGSGSTYRLEDDRFFSEKLIEPGESLLLRDTKPGVPSVGCCVNPLSETHAPSAEYRLYFVQFADGSVFGDPAEAKDSFAIRQIILRGLDRLLQSYEDGGEIGFASRLNDLRSYVMTPSRAPKTNDQPPFFETSICRQILAEYDASGVGGALDRVREILKTADKHSAMIALHPPS